MDRALNFVAALGWIGKRIRASDSLERVYLIRFLACPGSGKAGQGQLNRRRALLLAFLCTFYLSLQVPIVIVLSIGLRPELTMRIALQVGVPPRATVNFLWATPIGDTPAS